MAINQALEAYKQNENDYVEGINSPHGRINILFDTIIANLENLMDNHPKTDFISLGKCINGISILANSLNMEQGGVMAQNLVELYEYCRKTINNYIRDKDIGKLEEAHAIFSKLSEGWKGIDPDKRNI